MRRGLILVTSRVGAAAVPQAVTAARGTAVVPAMRAGLNAPQGQRWMAQGETKDEKEKDKKEGGDEKKTAPKAGPGFFQTFFKSVREQMGAAAEADPKLKESQEELEKARQEALVKAEAAMQRAKIAAEEAKKRADILEEQTRPARERVGAGVGAGASAIGRVISKVAEQPAVRAVGRAAASGVQGVVGAAEAIDAKSREIERKIAESATATSVREALGEDSRLKRVEGKEIDTESDGLVIREETPWERRVRKLRESAWVGPVFEGAVAARQGVREGVGRMGDRVFGETETSLCMGEIKRDDPHFDLQRFLKKLEKETIPMVMEAFLTDKLEPLEEICTERSMAVLGTIIKDRLKKGLKIDPTILDLDEVELREARLVDSEPVLIVTFQTQQVHCVRNNKGEITEGGESEIRQIFYVWAMMRHFSEDIADAPTWKLHEMAIQHQTPLLA